MLSVSVEQYDLSLAYRIYSAVPVLRNVQARDNGNVSFSNYNNIPDLQGFDDFYGSGNFNGGSNGQTIVIQETETKCEVVKVKKASLR